MKKTASNNEKGFTIIEVVLVLAIAALIFLMVFIALPTLQRNQRDAQRRSDMSRVLSQISSYQANNKGKVPTDAKITTTFKDNYLGGADFVDPQGDPYVFEVGDTTGTATTGTDASNHTIYYYETATCDGEDAVISGTSQRLAAIRLQLEDNGIMCLSNEE